MKFIDKITKTANETYKYTTEKTSKLAKVVKLKSLISKDKEKVNEIYKKIGELVYQSHIRKYENNDILNKVEDLCKEIDAYSEEMENNRIELLKLKDLKQCQNCNFEIGLDFKFCPNCGIKQEENNENNKNNVEDDNKN